MSKKKLQVPGMRVLDRAAIEAEVERLRALAEHYASLVAAAKKLEDAALMARKEKNKNDRTN